MREVLKKKELKTKQEKLDYLWDEIERKTDPDVFSLITDLVEIKHLVEAECNK